MLAFLGLPGGQEWIIILIIAVLLFGARLPSVFRSLGKSVTEFKKGLRDVEGEIDSASEISDSGEMSDSSEKAEQDSYPVG